ncbi:MAG: methyltransferase domain-containing protein [Planctomycetota bacterium]
MSLARLSGSPRDIMISTYLDGPMRGLEIGAREHPQPLPSSIKVRYVDLMSLQELEAAHPDMKGRLARVDIVAPGETLAGVPDASEDFVIAHHVMEHFQDALAGLGNMLRVLVNGGLLVMSVPDKRFTFDCRRQNTPLDHFAKDTKDGGASAKRAHLVEMYAHSPLHDTWTRAEVEAQIESNMQDERFSTHYHVWTADSFASFLEFARRHVKVPFEIELIWQRGIETLVVLRRHDDEAVVAANMGALERAHPGVAQWIAKVDDYGRLGQYTITARQARVGVAHFHDPQDPEGEARSLAAQWLDRTGSGPVRVLGFGLGFHLEALLKTMGPEQPLEVQLVDRTLFKLCLRRRLLTLILADPRLKFVSNLTPQTAFMLPSLTGAASR